MNSSKKGIHIVGPLCIMVNSIMAQNWPREIKTTEGKFMPYQPKPLMFLLTRMEIFL
jgi:hypothetical protein